MKKFVTGLMALLCLVSVLPVQVFSADEPIQETSTTFAEDYEEMYDHTAGYVESAFLGVAQFFTMFSENAVVSATVNGNIATDLLTANNTFGTDVTVGSTENSGIFSMVDHNYIGSVKSISGNILKSPVHKVVFGQGTILTPGNNNAYNVQYVDGTTTQNAVDNLKYDNTFIESTSYLGTASTGNEVKQVLSSLEDKSIELATYAKNTAPDNATNDSVFSSNSNVVLTGFDSHDAKKVVDVSGVTDTDKSIFVHVSADMLNSDTELNVTGMSKSQSGVITPNIIFIVDTTNEPVTESTSDINQSDITTGLKIHLYGKDNNEIVPPSKEGSEGILKNTNPLLWTFVNNSLTDPTPYQGSFGIKGAPWIGSILLPAGSISSIGDAYGNFIAKNVTASGGTLWRWNWGGYANPTVPDEIKKTLKIVKYDKNTGKEVAAQSNMTFKLTGDNLPTEGVTVDSDSEFTVSELPAGNYSIEETTAPIDYFLDSNKMNFSIAEDGTVTNGDGDVLSEMTQSEWDEKNREKKRDGFYLDSSGTIVFSKYDYQEIKLVINKYDYDKVMTTVEAKGMQDYVSSDKSSYLEVDTDENKVKNTDGMKFEVRYNVLSDGTGGELANYRDGNWYIPRGLAIQIKETSAPSGYELTDCVGVNHPEGAGFGFTATLPSSVLGRNSVIATSENQTSTLDNIQQFTDKILVFNKHDKVIPKDITLKINKLDADTEQNVPEEIRDNFHFKITDENGAIVNDYENVTPTTSLELQTNKKYIITEVSADSSYEVKTTSFVFSINADGTVNVDESNDSQDQLTRTSDDSYSYTFNIYDQKKPERTINLQKLGLPDAPEAPEGIITNPDEISEDALKAMAFTITDTTTKKTDEFTGDYTLQYGHSYMIEETVAPTGYEITNAKYYFEFTTDGEIEPRSENDAVSGAVNELAAESTEINYDTITQNVDGNFTFLKYDKKTPAKGYLPSTGGKGTQNYFIYGASVFLVVLAYYFIRRKRTIEG